ncbi:MAG TPA: agmatine deiminase family protein [Bacteroidota bacterium]|nr:agmatine deiminase family protein [Bacteroidota bacterium]
MPAEWEHHEATWIGWPHNRTDWPGKFAPIPWVYGEIVRKISPGEIVRIIVESAPHEASARRVLKKACVDPDMTEFFRFPTDRGWARDFGPIAVRRGNETAFVGFLFNAWAKYPNWKKDARVHARAAKALGVRLFDATLNGKQFVLEGGSIDVNGSGTLLTTEECLLDPAVQARNPGATKQDIERALCDNLGVTNILWLGRGITGDDTHGHVDDITRFVNRRTIVTCVEEDESDINYAPLRENRERLEGLHLEDGSKPEVVSLPLPSPLSYGNLRLPASYANFYISNACVIVPTFNDPRDRTALGILSELFTDRPVVGIHAVDLVLGFGTLHCLSQQQPG